MRNVLSYLKAGSLKRAAGVWALAWLCGVAYGDTTIQYSTTSDWGGGFNGQITITNKGGQPLSGWALEFDFERSIDVIWSATVASHTGAHYKIQSAGWNDVIPAGGAVSFGFGGSPGSVQQGPSNFQLTGSGDTTPAPPSAPSAAIGISQVSQWDGGFTGNLTIKNLGSQAIASWVLGFNFVPAIQSVWNGSFTQQG